MGKPRLKMTNGHARPKHSKVKTHRDVKWCPGESHIKVDSLNGMKFYSTMRQSEDKLSDADVYHNQFKGMSHKLAQAYRNILTPGRMFSTRKPVKITGAALQGTHDTYPEVTGTYDSNFEIFAPQGASAIYVGEYDVVRSAKLDGITHKMSAKLHVFILRDKQVIPTNLLLFDPVCDDE